MAKESSNMPIPLPKDNVEFARLRMMQARKVLEDYEARKDARNCKLHSTLTNAFQRATTKYLKLSASKS